MDHDSRSESESGPPPDETYAKPRPRAPRSPAQAAQVRKQNRRKEYLQRHPSYYNSVEHELADPILYDVLIRRFQTPEEREKEGKAKGYSRVLEADLLRGEARLSQISEEARGVQVTRDPSTIRRSSGAASAVNDKPQFREEGQELWASFLEERFVLGEDDTFDYDPVDADDSLDVMEKRDEEDSWFDAEDPEWASDVDGADDEGKIQLEGETGIQDY